MRAWRAAHQVSGTLGTYSFENARQVIQATLSKLARTQRDTPPPSPWHSVLETYLKRDTHVQRRVCKERLWFFCRLRGQTAFTAEQSWGPSSVERGGRGLGGSEEAAVYLSRELAKLGYCVRVYGNPPPGTSSVYVGVWVWVCIHTHL